MISIFGIFLVNKNIISTILPIFSVCFMIDIFLRINVGIYKKGHIDYDRVNILQEYKSNYAIIDLIVFMSIILTPTVSEYFIYALTIKLYTLKSFKKVFF